MTRTRLIVPVVIVAAATFGLTACSQHENEGAQPNSSSAAEQLSSRTMPSFLPSHTPQGVPTGSAKEPAMSYQGMPLVAQLDPGVSAKVVVLGPEPPSGDTKAGEESADLTWQITFSEVTKDIPLSPAQFNIQDGTGAFHTMSPKGDPLPRTIKAGRTTSVKMHAVVPSGDGMVRWAPDGKHVVALWDYIAELD